MIVAIDDVQWLDVPSARVLAFVVRRLEDAPVRILLALRVGSGGDPLGLGRAGPAPSLHRVPVGPLREEAMTRLLRARTEGELTRPVLLRLHRISEGNPFFALEIARALAEQGVGAAPGEPLPVPEDLQALLGTRLAALPSSSADLTLVVAAAGYHFDAGDATRATVLLEAGCGPRPNLNHDSQRTTSTSSTQALTTATTSEKATPGTSQQSPPPASTSNDTPATTIGRVAAWVTATEMRGTKRGWFGIGARSPRERDARHGRPGGNPHHQHLAAQHPTGLLGHQREGRDHQHGDEQDDCRQRRTG
ncbi:MAG TPA: hypothetical protein VHM23_20495 [Actinomycetota bacterium]|nr:hypothetical protein [Actinomycetota bacterium]